MRRFESFRPNQVSRIQPPGAAMFIPIAPGISFDPREIEEAFIRAASGSRAVTQGAPSRSAWTCAAPARCRSNCAPERRCLAAGA